MKRNKQNWILKLIQDAGSRGINTNDLRRITFTVDVPKVVSILNDKGHKISSKREHDGTATYFITDRPKKWWEDAVMVDNCTGERKSVETVKTQSYSVA